MMRSAQCCADNKRCDEAGHACDLVQVDRRDRGARRVSGAGEIVDELVLETEKTHRVDGAGDKGQHAGAYPYPTWLASVH